ncbi:MAG: penicillin-binding protein 2 [Bacteroidales bacterium]|nr:penicillin-binding protein 2 [Bacteroidales bacterium]
MDVSGNIKKNRDRIGVILYVIYVLLLLASVLLFVKLVGIQIFFRPEPKIATALTPTSRARTIEPVRGNIIDSKGRLLAMSCPTYQIAMDCTVRREEFAADKKNGADNELKWLDKARELSVELAKVFPEKTSDQYYKLICDGRRNGKKYLKFGKPVDRNVYNRIKTFPLFNESRYKGGLIAEQKNIRIYPYGKLARRTIGFVRDNSSSVGNTHVGLEGKFDYVLHGQEGKEWLKVTDYGRVQDNDSTRTRAEDGKDIRTTINIDYQDIAARALYEEIKEETDLEGACLVLMESATGAIRAMVNLYRDGDATDFEEVSNLAIGRAIEPGSVFKTVTLMQVLSDGYIKSLDETIPTNHGVIKGVKTIPQDVHILDHERIHKTNSIAVIDGFKISSNYVFGSLAVNNYSKKPMRFIENIHSYKLAEAFDFDLAGLASPIIPSPKDKNRYWSMSDLAVMGYGYGTRETPLHILTFYNAIANKGKMMKPYLVEDIEKDGVVKSRRGPALMSTICSKAVADTLTRALKAVTEEGTARRLKDAKCQVAGKTGTSFGTYAGGSYKDEYGRRKYQGTFVGFFPADEPRYSVICTVFSKPTSKQFQGGGIPARAVKELVNGLYAIDPCFQPRLEAAK